MSGSVNARERSRNGAFVEALHRKYGDALMRFLRRRRLAEADAEDIAQDAYCRISRMQDVETIEYPQAFLFRTAANLLHDHSKYGRRHHANDHVGIDGLALASTAPSAERIIEAKEQLAIVRMALTELSPKCLAVFTMHRFDAMSYREIAGALDLSISMVEKYIMRALAHCRRRVKEAENAEADHLSAAE